MSLLTFIALLSLGASVEDWRGNNAWAAVAQSHLDRGDPLDVLPPPPAPVPVAENFFGHPLLARLYFAKSTNSEIVALARSVPLASQAVPLKWTDGESADLAAICALIAERDTQKKMPDLPPQEAPARRLLAHLAGASHFLAELRHSAIYRTESQPVRSSPTRLENIFKTEIPAWRFARFTTQLLSLHACASLTAGDTKTAFADTLAGLQFSRGAASSADTIVETMIAVVIVKPAIQPVWEGIRAHKWSDTQLARFQAVLTATDFFAALNRGLIIERNGALALFPKRFAVLPDGWAQQNRAYYAIQYSHEIDVIASQSSPPFRSHLIDVEARENAKATEINIHPYQFFTNWIFSLPQLSKITRTTAFSANAVRLALTACALERHYLARGVYPESLDKLVPTYLPAVPLDVINGDPLRYRLNPDATFALYSVGLDGDDDHGHRALSGSHELTTDGDWAW